MRKALVVLASVILLPLGAGPSFSSELGVGTQARSGVETLRFLFPDNIDCRDFDRTAYKVWQLRNRSPLDLGNWDGPFEISGPISPGLFVRKGFDLFNVLEAKCGMHAWWDRNTSRPSS